jgi:hypothetical protein
VSERLIHDPDRDRDRDRKGVINFDHWLQRHLWTKNITSSNLL